MTSYDDIVRRWVNVTLGTTKKPLYPEGNSRVFARGDRLFSYGSHFELARPIRIRGKVSHWLLNGDTFSISTSRHQSLVRTALTRTGLPMVIIPHSALAQAGIDLNSIRILEVTPDTHLTTTIIERELPARAVWKYEYDTVEGTGGYLTPDGEFMPYYQSHHYPYHDRKAWQEVKSVTRNTGRRYLATQENTANSWELFDDDGQIAYRRETHRHLLGQSLITARVWGRHTRPARFLSGFDQNETRPSYFFCELPRTSRAVTVDEAYEDLKPGTVKQAEAMGREVRRQGDIFAIPVPTLDKRALRKMGAVFTQGAHLWNTNHKATETARLGDGTTLVRGTLTHDPAARRPDHKRVGLGKAWHVALKNTVPVTV